MKKFGIVVIFILLVAVSSISLRAQSNVFVMPLLQSRHMLLVQQMAQQVQHNDFKAMEATCRAAIAILPEEPTWHYNLACALARQARTKEALEVLESAVKFGFSDINTMANDKDLAPLRRVGRFEELLAEMRKPAAKGVGEGAHSVNPATVGESALISNENTRWDFNLGNFLSFFAITNNQQQAALPLEIGGEEGERLNQWIKEGSAAGNRGDLYDNRDKGHSALKLSLYPEMRPVIYDSQAKEANADNGLCNFLFNGVVTLGNSSTAMTSGPYWRSNPRRACTDQRSMLLLAMQYLRNQLYLYPRHRDYDAAHEGDVYPALSPYMVISDGSSGSDQPLLRALAAALAALRPEVKSKLAAQGLIAPTLQMLLRASQRGVTNRLDYLSRVAHPVAFDGTQTDLARMLTMAHDLRADALPPVAVFRCREEEPAAIGRDFFDFIPTETLFDTPSASARVMRSMHYTHRYLLDGTNSRDPNGKQLVWRWFLLQGDKDKVRIKPKQLNSAVVEVEVDYHGGSFEVEGNGGPIRSSRVEIALVVDNGSHFSAPAIFNCFFLNNEVRKYGDNGEIVSVDYEVAAKRYVDPMISLPRNWRDLYIYDSEKRLVGWSRFRGEKIESFTAAGARILTRDERGRALTARPVIYQAKVGNQGAGGNAVQPEVVQVDIERTVAYSYADDDDLVGKGQLLAP